MSHASLHAVKTSATAPANGVLAADLYAVWQVVMQLANELAETAVVVGDVEVGSRVGSVVEDGSQEDGSHRHGIGTHTPNTHSYTHSVPANTWHGVHVCQLVHWVPAHGFVGSRA